MGVKGKIIRFDFNYHSRVHRDDPMLVVIIHYVALPVLPFSDLSLAMLPTF